MRSLLSLICAFLVGTSILFLSPGSVAYANFHCMRIHAVMAGFNGNNNVQYVELRMTQAGQSALTGHTIQFYDGSNVLKATFTFPSTAISASIGDSILIATTEFNSAATGGAADFTFTGNTTGSGDLNHPVQSPNGKVVFQPLPSINCGNPTMPVEVDSVAYGTGTPNFGSAAAALPSPGDNRALRLDLLTYPPTDASVHNALTPVSATTFSVSSGNLSSDLSTPRNNGRTVLQLNATGSVGGLAEAPNQAQNDVTTAGGNGRRDRVAYGLVAVVAASLAASGAGWYVYRRRIAARE